LISIDEIDDLLNGVYSTLTPAYSYIRLGQSGELLPPSDYTTDATGTSDRSAELKLDAVFSHYHRGGTIILQRIHQFSSAIARLCRHLQLYFGFVSQANAYLTPPESQGFSAHFDTHDVFVVQITGSKKWRIYNTVVPFASPGTVNQVEHRKQYELTREVTVSAGDLLYIPRGLVHEAATSNDESLHLTLGVNPYTLADVIKEAVDSALKHCEPLRRNVSSRFLDGNLDKSKVSEAFLTAVNCLSDSIMCDVIDGKLARSFDTLKPLLPGQLAQVALATRLNNESIVALRDTVKCRLEVAEDGLNLSFHGKSLDLPRFVQMELQQLLTGEDFQVKDLVGELSDNGRLVLVRRLVQEGFIEIRPQ
jgi:hypothetical protein